MPDVCGLIWIDAGMFDHHLRTIRHQCFFRLRRLADGEQRKQLGAVKEDVEVTRPGNFYASNFRRVFQSRF
jgi:hypothetical protein